MEKTPDGATEETRGDGDGPLKPATPPSSLSSSSSKISSSSFTPSSSSSPPSSPPSSDSTSDEVREKDENLQQCADSRTSVPTPYSSTDKFSIRTILNLRGEGDEEGEDDEGEEKEDIDKDEEEMENEKNIKSKFVASLAFTFFYVRIF